MALCYVVGPIGLAMAYCVGLYDRLASMALKATNVWDVIPGDLVACGILGAAATTAAGIPIDADRRRSASAENMMPTSPAPCATWLAAHHRNDTSPDAQQQRKFYNAQDAALARGGTQQTPGITSSPLIIHAATSTTYPISMVEAQWAAVDFVKDNPPPFRLPGGRLFKVPLNYKPDEAAVKAAKQWMAWKVSGVVDEYTTTSEPKHA